MKEDLEPWHAFDISTVLEKLQSSPSGLHEEEAAKRLQLFGPNTLAVKSAVTIPGIFLRQLNNPLVYVLIGSTLAALAFGKLIDGIVVFSVVILNTLIGFIQEYKAHSTIKALMSMMPHLTTVIRNNETKSLPASALVPGDIVILQAGDRIPADLRLLSTKNLQCDEASLTGESQAVTKQIDPSPTDTLLAEKTSIAFNGTYVASGSGLGVVIATGLQTEFGKISTLLEEVHTLETPLAIHIKKLAQGLTIAILFISMGLFFVGYWRGKSLFDAGLSAIALAVASIPEGLPAIITIAESVGIRRMARKHALIRQLPAVEALGSTSIICTDKTGTLTYNEMTIQKIWTQSGLATVSGVGYSPEGQFFLATPAQSAEIQPLLQAAILCNDASLTRKDDKWSPVGDPTELALIVAGRKLGLQEEKLREEYPRLDVIPFESERRIMASLHSSPLHKTFIFVKGAPEEILQICTKTDREEIEKNIHNMAKEGMRVLAIAKKETSLSNKLEEAAVKDGYTFLGLVGMIDPPRNEVIEALKNCHNAGITVKMITGDHPVTAKAISQELGLLGNGQVITGTEMNQFNATQWHQAISRAHVFARSSPEHKLQLVTALQAAGHTIAMTGDGVNDAPALKRADIGIAMGIKGTAVAKEAADMILADDNFASIANAVREGRRFYDNLCKALLFVLPTSFGQALVIILAVLFFPIQEGLLLHPIAPLQILWVNLVVAIALSLPLAFEPEESDIMKRPPRKKTASFLDGFFLIRTLTVSLLMAIETLALFLWAYHNSLHQGLSEEMALAEAQTLAVTGIILCQVWYLFHCRTLRDPLATKKFFANPFIFVGVGLVLLAQMAFVYLPFMQAIFKSKSLNVQAWFIATLVTLSVIPIISVEKWIRKKFFS